jgi:hypothetical protein
LCWLYMWMISLLLVMMRWRMPQGKIE